MIRHLASVLLGLALALPASAEQVRYFKVEGVAANDTLSVREGPSASAAKIGELAPDTPVVEITATNADGTWGRTIWYEGDGWVSMRYLARAEIDTFFDTGPGHPTGVPVGLSCGGNEPFWGLSFDAPDRLVYSTPETPETALSVGAIHVASGRRGLPVSYRLATPDFDALAIVSAAACSDTMSDRTYGYQINLWTEDETGATFRTGCCSLPADN